MARLQGFLDAVSGTGLDDGLVRSVASVVDRCSADAVVCWCGCGAGCVVGNGCG